MNVEVGISKNLEPAFHEAMRNIYKRANAEYHYNATRFLQLVTDQGGLRAAQILLKPGSVSDGLMRLWKESRLDISMEALVQQEPWRRLFTTEELSIAYKRLLDLGYVVEWPRDV